MDLSSLGMAGTCLGVLWSVHGSREAERKRQVLERLDISLFISLCLSQWATRRVDSSSLGSVAPSVESLSLALPVHLSVPAFTCISRLA